MWTLCVLVFVKKGFADGPPINVIWRTLED
jgi:hypothetical protein